MKATVYLIFLNLIFSISCNQPSENSQIVNSLNTTKDDSTIKIFYDSVGNKISEYNKLKNQFVKYQNGSPDTIKNIIGTDTVRRPYAYDNTLIEVVICYKYNFYNYDNGVLISSGYIEKNKPVGEVKYYKNNNVIRTEIYDINGGKIE